MKARSEADTNTLIFECAGGGHMASESDKHRHRAVIVRLDEDRISTEWQEWSDGEPTHTASFNLARR